MFFITLAENLIKELVKYNILGEVHPTMLTYLENKNKIQNDYLQRFGASKIDNFSKTRQISRENDDGKNFELQYDIELFEVAMSKNKNYVKNSIQGNKIDVIRDIQIKRDIFSQQQVNRKVQIDDSNSKNT